tara:strand:+ start:223 stop:324 length:102 start_codon:yes stop_codon:yes gene_type:complete
MGTTPDLVLAKAIIVGKELPPATVGARTLAVLR